MSWLSSSQMATVIVSLLTSLHCDPVVPWACVWESSDGAGGESWEGPLIVSLTDDASCHLVSLVRLYKQPLPGGGLVLRVGVLRGTH